MSKIKLFPNQKGSNRSCYFTVGCGEAALLTGFFPCEGISMCINKVSRDKCNCEHLEKQYCQIGRRAGLNSSCCEGSVVMPGEYVAMLTLPECVDLPNDDEWGIFVEVCKALPNIQTLSAAAAASNS